jgi:hypothetical protein
MTVSSLPGNNAVAQDSNTLDFTLHRIANLEVAGFGIGAQGARAGSSAHRDYVARSVFHGWSRPLGLHKATVVPGLLAHGVPQRLKPERDNAFLCGAEALLHSKSNLPASRETRGTLRWNAFGI